MDGCPAVQHWGELRFTRDVDLTLLTDFGDEEAYIEPFLDAFAPRVEGCRGVLPFEEQTLHLPPVQTMTGKCAKGGAPSSLG